MRCWEEIERSMYEPRSYFRLRWGRLSGFRSGGGRMGAYGMLQSRRRCQYLQGLWAVPTDGALLPTGTTGAAYWASLLQRPQSIVGPSESASQWIIYVLSPTCQLLYDTLFAMYCKDILGVRQIHLQNGNAVAQLCLRQSWIAVLFTSATKQPPSLFPLSLSHSDVFTVWLRCRGLTGREKTTTKKRSAHSLYITLLHLTTPHHPNQPRQNEVEGVSVGLKIEIASAPHIFHQHWNSPPFLGING